MKPKQPEQPKGKEQPKPSGKQTPTDKTKPGAKPKTPIDSKKPQPQGKNAKGKGKNMPEPEEEEEKLPPPEKVKNLERFIYVSTYSDSELMKKLKELFEEINQPAFQLRSVKEIYTRGLSPEEQDDNEIDYISGCQLIDKELRITIIEGITGKAMVKVKEKLPKTQMNCATFKVFADSKVLFNKRIYSKFELNLKYIKLRDNLTKILMTHDIYSKANKYKEIYQAFMNYGSILRSKTMLEIQESNLFPDAESLLLLERKYADILNDEDLSGIHIVKKTRKRVRADSLLEKSVGLNNSVVSLESKTSRNVVPNQTTKLGQSEEDENKKQSETTAAVAEKTDDMMNFHKKSLNQTMIDNKNFLKTMSKKPHQAHFCQPYDGDDEEVYLYSQTRKNFYATHMDSLRQKYKDDRNHYYTYSRDALTLSFPMVPDVNHAYLNYLDNKSKWTNKEDFNRWQQPKRDYIYFPKINNIL